MTENRARRSEPLLGAAIEAEGARFGALATRAHRCAVRLFAPDGRAVATHPMRALGGGYFEAEVKGAGPGTLYKFVLDDRELPDPYARCLPHGVHGPAMVAPSKYVWRFGPGVHRPLGEQVFYELHVGTFTPQGTYAGAIEKLGELATLGIGAIELMPLAAFAGSRGWGYDGVALFAPFAPYGTPDDLRRLIDEAHGKGLSVFLDVVYNHLGPSGNYLGAYCPEYFTHEEKNAWGDAPNFGFAPMRRCVLDNARYWLTEFRFDGLRLDSIQNIVDRSPRHILRELADQVALLTPKKVLVAEDHRNDPAPITELGLDGMWIDDFHHQVRVTLTGERDGYFAAYERGPKGIARTINGGWLYEGQPYPPTGQPRGKSAGGLPASSFVYCIQNHDQVGNRALGDRLSSELSLDAFCAASMLLLCLPMTPLIFMGQEWAASSPFLYFTDHEPQLGRLVAEGRRREFAAFAAFRDPAARALIPDPQEKETFARSCLRWPERKEPQHARVLELHRRLLELRRTDPVLRDTRRENTVAEARKDVLFVRRASEGHVRWLVTNFSPSSVPLSELTELDRTSSLVLASSPAPEGQLPGFTAAWFAHIPSQNRRSNGT
jgi:maltooligosyltrehalose trehalohydrolase